MFINIILKIRFNLNIGMKFKNQKTKKLKASVETNKTYSLIMCIKIAEKCTLRM